MTYQAGKLVVVRRDATNPDLINTHFRNFNKPMGLAAGNQRLAIGTAQEIVEFRNVPAAAPRLEPAVFSGIPITERLDEAERTCGVWAVDIRSGQVVAFVKFEEAVQEIFAVSVLAGCEFLDLINDDPKITGSSFVLPDTALQEVPEALQSTSIKSGGETP